MENFLFNGMYPWSNQKPDTTLPSHTTPDPDKPTRKEVENMINDALKVYEKTATVDEKLTQFYGKDTVDSLIAKKTSYDYVDSANLTQDNNINLKANKSELDLHKDEKASYFDLGHVRAVDRVPASYFPLPVAVDENGQLWSQESGSEGAHVYKFVSPLSDNPMDKTVDDSIPIQTAIDELFEIGGGTVVLDSGVYIMKKQVTMKPNVNLFGNNVVFKVFSSDYTHTDNCVLFVPKWCTANNIEGINFVYYDEERPYILQSGVMGLRQYRDTLYGYFSPTGLKGLYFEDVGTDTETYNHNLVYSKGQLPVNADKVTYKLSTVSHCKFMGFPSEGLFVGGNNYCIIVNDIYATKNGVGVWLFGSDIVFENIVAESNAYEGIITRINNVKGYGCKVIWNGGLTARNNRLSLVSAYETTYAFNCNASRAQLSNIETQDNFCFGQNLDGNNITAVNMLSDSDCNEGDIFHGQDDFEPSSHLFRVNGFDNHIELEMTNYAFDRRGWNCEYGVFFDLVVESDVTAKCDHRSYFNKYHPSDLNYEQSCYKHAHNTPTDARSTANKYNGEVL